MMHTNKPYLAPEQIRKIDDVITALEHLEHDLPASQLRRLHNFNRAYVIITRNVRIQLKRGAFEYPRFLESFDTRFADYYLDALREFVKGRQTTPSWQTTFSYAQKPQASSFIALALGVNAHVNNDIPQVLHDCHATNQHYRDYLLINTIIRDSVHEVIDSMDEYHRFLSPKRKALRPMYFLVMNVLIRYWRRSAWRKFKRIERDELNVATVEQSAQRIALVLQRLPI